MDGTCPRIVFMHWFCTEFYLFGDNLGYVSFFPVLIVTAMLQPSFYFDMLTFYEISGTGFGLFAPYSYRDKFGLRLFTSLIVVGLHGKMNGGNTVVVTRGMQFDVLRNFARECYMIHN